MVRVFVVCMKKLCIIGYPEWGFWSESLLDAFIRRYVFQRYGSICSFLHVSYIAET